MLKVKQIVVQLLHLTNIIRHLLTVLKRYIKCCRKDQYLPSVGLYRQVH